MHSDSEILANDMSGQVSGAQRDERVRRMEEKRRFSLGVKFLN